ncbi:autotransporter outer membrane beta-barrel domain-containing protein [Escherichia coli]|nr:autotransporter outer membrane beta-barrel domain-containing protein [Escherichia coli]
MPGGTLRVAKTTIGGNLENGGTVQMNTEGGKPGNVLTVNGNYTGNNGLMTFNATLGGDNSPTDKMNVKGDTQGNTRVRVDNIGGVGAQTVNGIELIEVGGNSAGNFALTTGTLGEVRTGVEAKVNNNLSLWGNVGVQLGDKGYSDTQGMLGVKYSW